MDIEDVLGSIPPTWEYTTLGEVCIRGGGNIQTGPFGSQLHASDYVAKGIPAIMPANIGDNRINENGIARIRESDAIRLERYRVKPGDIVYSRRGDVERRALIRVREDGWLCGTGCLRVSLGNSVTDPAYAAFYLDHPAVREWIVRHAHGATMPNLNTEILSNCPFVLPPIEEQKYIATTLSALDDKIELNRQMNETLEAMARAVFKDWFVDFGPTRAKAEGRPPYLAPDLWSLFPDRLDDEGKPEGWIGGCLRDVADLRNGFAFKSSDWQEDGVPVVKIGSVKPAVVDLTQVSFVSAELASERATFRLNVGDVLVGLTGYVGETGRVPPTENPPLLNQRVARFSASGGFSPFVFSCVRDPAFKIFAEGKGHGSAQANVSTRDLLSYPIGCAEAPLIAAYNEIAAPLYEKSLSNLGEMSTLAATRDLLLPKLMSGEIRVQDAETALAAVA
ncbi:MAG: hypothetical protein B7Z71_04755 [Acidocella sp. 21-58-7]|nr:MAG: hypothetical protein B7Z71_04755 [Acidocella sp. 21-58-7]